MSKIIIDGVDISNCPYCLNNKLKGKTHSPAKSMPYAKETSCIACKTEVTKYNFCKHNPNCHYKQLQRLKAENEELKKSLKEITLYTTRHCTDKRALYVDKLLFDCNKAEHCLDEIERRCNKYQTCRIVLKEDILQIIQENRK